MTPRQNLIRRVVMHILMINREALEHNLAIKQFENFDNPLAGYIPADDNRMNGIVEECCNTADTIEYYAKTSDKQYSRMVSEIIKETTEKIEQMWIAYQYKYQLSADELAILNHMRNDPIHAEIKLNQSVLENEFVSTYRYNLNSEYAGYFSRSELSPVALKSLYDKGFLVFSGYDRVLFTQEISGKLYSLKEREPAWRQ